MSTSQSQELPPSKIPIFTTVAAYREWRNKAFAERKSVGFVATMGALHAGHLTLVKHSLAENDLTVVSIFVNPAQFAPHEDLATYPRTLAHDLDALASLRVPTSTGSEHTADAVFAPTVGEMYPGGITQELAAQKGTFVEVKGFSHQMEGQTRPTFFRGVATVVAKLFNIIQPTRTYFGQKDIQQALLLRRMTRDLLLANPTPENLHIVPIARDPLTSLALSSRNAYLTAHERSLGAPTLIAALRAAKSAWTSGLTKAECIARARALVASRARDLGDAQHVEAESDERAEAVRLELDYIEMNDAETFDVLPDGVMRANWEAVEKGRPVLLSGAMYVGKTRLIDNVILGDEAKLGVVKA